MIRKSTWPARVKWLLWTAIIVLLGLIASIFINYRMSSKPVDRPAPPEETRATLSINNFEHVAMKDGRKQWMLDAESAKLFSDQQIAVLSNMTATVFSSEELPVVVTAERGRLDLATKDMEASGGVFVQHPQYSLMTESLKYIQDSNIMRMDSPVEITGDSARIRADSATYDTATGAIVLEGHVEGWFSEIFN